MQHIRGKLHNLARFYSWEKGDIMKLGEYLIQNKLITSDQLNQALELQKKKPEQKIGEILVELEYLTPEALQKAIDGNNG
jgi:hypothetical protein